MDFYLQFLKQIEIIRKHQYYNVENGLEPIDDYKSLREREAWIYKNLINIDNEQERNAKIHSIGKVRNSKQKTFGLSLDFYTNGIPICTATTSTETFTEGYEFNIDKTINDQKQFFIDFESLNVIHVTCVGFELTNIARFFIPNFLYTYGFVHLNVKDNIISTNERKVDFRNAPVLLTEYVENPLTIKDVIGFDQSFETHAGLILQLFNAMFILDQICKEHHLRLDLDYNIMIREIEETIPIYISNRSKKYIKVDFVLCIVNFELCSYNVSDPFCGYGDTVHDSQKNELKIFYESYINLLPKKLKTIFQSLKYDSFNSFVKNERIKKLLIQNKQHDC